MAVEIEFSNVIARKGSVDAKFPGGLDAFAATDLPNYIEDNDLIRVGFMSTGASFDLVDKLTSHGLTCNTSSVSDLAIVDFDVHPNWLTVGTVEGSAGCWLTGKQPGPLVKCTNGFLLRCPQVLFEKLETVLYSNGIETTRRGASDAQGEGAEHINFAQRNALISAEVIGGLPLHGIVLLLASRDFTRRQHCQKDIALAEKIKTILLSHGATD